MSLAQPQRRALVALALLLPAPSLGAAFALFLAPGTLGPWIYGLSKIWVALLPAAWCLVLERQPLSASPLRKGGLATGALLGGAIAAVIGIVYALLGAEWIDTGLMRERATESGIGTPATYLAFCAYVIFVNSLLEEYIWRWFVFRQCERLLGGGLAVFAAALLFTLHHVVALAAYFDLRTTALAALGVFLGATIWSWCYWRFRSVWPGYLSHALADIAILAIGYSLILG